MLLLHPAVLNCSFLSVPQMCCNVLFTLKMESEHKNLKVSSRRKNNVLVSMRITT